MGSVKKRRGLVCDICGDIGFAEDIVTCYLCKMASEHIYCMQNELAQFPEAWYCEGCLRDTQSVNQRQMQDVYAEAAEPNSEAICLEMEKIRTPVISSPLNFRGAPELINGGEKQHTEIQKPLYSPDGSRNPSLGVVENAKAKFIPKEEDALLTFGVRVSNKQGNQSASSSQSYQANVMPPPISKRKSTTTLTSPKLKACKVITQPNKGTVELESKLSPSKGIVIVEQVRNNKESKREKNKYSAEQALAVSLKEELEDLHAHAKVNDSPMELIKPMESCIDLRPLHTTDKNEQVGSGFDICSVVPTKESGSQGTDLSLMLLINPNEKNTNRPTPQACWKGTFEVLDVVYHVYTGIEAHYPRQLSVKVYEISKLMPEKLRLKMLPREDAWPQKFHFDAPTCEDIGLFFFPREFDKSKEKYIRLMERIDSRDSALQTYVGDIELLIFTSKQLPEDSQKIDAQTYLWGVFRHVKNKKCSRPQLEQSPAYICAANSKRGTCDRPNVLLEDNGEEVDMEIDMVGGIEINRVDRVIPRFESPPDFPKPLREGNHAERPLVKFSLKKATKDIPSAAPPGFPLIPTFKNRCSSSAANTEDPSLSKKDK